MRGEGTSGLALVDTTQDDVGKMNFRDRLLIGDGWWKVVGTRKEKRNGGALTYSRHGSG